MNTARARRYALDRFQRETFELAGTAYRGAAMDRARENWVPETGSADELALPELDTLRARSQDLNRNDPFASALTRAMVDLVVGRGFRPQCRINHERLGITERQASEFQDAAEQTFELWEQTADVATRMRRRQRESLRPRRSRGRRLRRSRWSWSARPRCRSASPSRRGGLRVPCRAAVRRRVARRRGPHRGRPWCRSRACVAGRTRANLAWP